MRKGLRLDSRMVLWLAVQMADRMVLMMDKKWDIAKVC
jgi:hypothetical protein